MTERVFSMGNIEHLSDLDWFDRMCSILEKNNCPTTHQLTNAIGNEDLRYSKEKRGSKFLIPLDTRFKTACINPDITYSDTDQPPDLLSFGGTDFKLGMVDIVQRFNNYKTQRNTYDGGTQIFFYPIPKKFEFLALSFPTDKEPEEINEINSLVFHHVTFHFGDHVALARDGYHVLR